MSLNDEGREKAMADIFSRAKRSEIMRRIKAKNTTPEIMVRQYLFKQGFRFRLHKKELPGNPDIVLAKYKMVIFVQGCFWHGHSCKIGSGQRKPKTNNSYWQIKLQKNVDRHSINKKSLTKLGWKVIEIWECQILNGKGLVRRLESLKKIQ